MTTENKRPTNNICYVQYLKSKAMEKRIKIIREEFQENEWTADLISSLKLDISELDWGYVGGRPLLFMRSERQFTDAELNSIQRAIASLGYFTLT